MQPSARKNVWASSKEVGHGPHSCILREQNCACSFNYRYLYCEKKALYRIVHFTSFCHFRKGFELCFEHAWPDKIVASGRTKSSIEKHAVQRDQHRLFLNQETVKARNESENQKETRIDEMCANKSSQLNSLRFAHPSNKLPEAAIRTCENTFELGPRSTQDRRNASK